MKKLIREFHSFSRDYTSIKHKLLYVFDLIASDDDLEDFEMSDDYNPNMTDSQYVQAYVKYDLDNIKENKVNEDGGAGSGVASATMSGGGGMGAVITPIASPIPGDTTSNLAISGSGDIGATTSMNRNIRSDDDTESPRNRRKKKIKNALKKKKFKAANDSTKGSNLITKFSDYKSK